MGSNKLDTSKLVFEDQLSLVSGYLQSLSNDPLAPLIGNANYLDLGASFIIHSNKYLVGLSAQHLNQPNISYNKEKLIWNCSLYNTLTILFQFVGFSIAGN